MDKERRQEPKGWLEREGAGLCEKARYELETAPARRWRTPRLFLRQNDRDEEEINERENGQRPELTD
jgi:hypothetical protein